MSKLILVLLLIGMAAFGVNACGNRWDPCKENKDCCSEWCETNYFNQQQCGDDPDARANYRRTGFGN